MARSPLDFKLKQLGKTDGEFADLCGKHRTEIWHYRHRSRTPNYDTALAILAALEKLGVEMTLDELLCRKPRKKAA